MTRPFVLRLLLIFCALLSVQKVSSQHSSRNANLLRSNDNVASTWLSEEEESELIWRKWRRKKNHASQTTPKTAPPTSPPTSPPTCAPSTTPLFEFNGLVLTTIDIRSIEGNSNKVHFSGSIKADLDDETGVFVRNVVDTGLKEDNCTPIFEADLVDQDEVSRFFKETKILFSIHGYGREPDSDMKKIKTALKHFKHYKIVPIFWPTYDIDYENEATLKSYNNKLHNSYDHDLNVAKAVGKTLAIFFQNNNFVERNPDAHMSLLAHSLGNRVLQYFAVEVHALQLGIKFHNIFMVAADIDEHIFDTSDGVHIVDLLSDGKVYVTHRKDDLALVISARKLNSDDPLQPNHRLGQFGFKWGKLHPDVKSKVKNINLLGFPVPEYDVVGRHNYNLMDYLIWLYDSK